MQTSLLSNFLEEKVWMVFFLRDLWIILDAGIRGEGRVSKCRCMSVGWIGQLNLYYTSLHSFSTISV
jgi:hypothetical protein